MLLAGEQRAQEPLLGFFAAVGDDRGRGKEVPEEHAAAALRSTRGTQAAFDFATECRPYAHAAVADREVHPRETRVVLRAAEREGVLRSRIMRVEQR